MFCLQIHARADCTMNEQFSNYINVHFHIHVVPVCIPPPPPPTPWKASVHTKEEGSQKPKLFKGNHEVKLQFPEEWGLQTQKPFCGNGGVIFCHNTDCIKIKIKKRQPYKHDLIITLGDITNSDYCVRIVIKSFLKQPLVSLKILYLNLIQWI